MSLVIVAVPEKDDYVYKISSEKIPHMTVLYLGDTPADATVSKIADFIEHAANTMLEPFWLDVSERDELGPDKADVIFFEDSWQMPKLKSFRTALLRNDLIKSAYDSATQFPEWQPHLTLGYPKAPAKEDKRDYPGIHMVRFDRIALWTGDFEGPEFKLHRPKYDDALELAMSSTGEQAVQSLLEHHGVKGMKWGKRKSDAAPSSVTVAQKGTKLKAKGGENHPPTAEAVRVASLNRVVKKSGTHALTNAELQEVASRMNLEQQVSRLNSGNKKENAGKAFVTAQVKNKKNQQVATAWLVKAALKKAAATA